MRPAVRLLLAAGLGLAAADRRYKGREFGEVSPSTFAELLPKDGDVPLLLLLTDVNCDNDLCNQLSGKWREIAEEVAKDGFVGRMPCNDDLVDASGVAHGPFCKKGFIGAGETLPPGAVGEVGFPRVFVFARGRIYTMDRKTIYSHGTLGQFRDFTVGGYIDKGNLVGYYDVAKQCLPGSAYPCQLSWLPASK